MRQCNSTSAINLCTDYGRMIPNSLQPKTMSQTQIENPVKCMKIVTFCWKNSLITYTKSQTRNTQWQNLRIDSTTTLSLKYLTTYSADQPNCPKDLGYIFKKTHWMSVVRQSVQKSLLPTKWDNTYVGLLCTWAGVFISWLHLPQWSRYVWAMMPIEKNLPKM